MNDSGSSSINLRLKHLAPAVGTSVMPVLLARCDVSSRFPPTTRIGPRRKLRMLFVQPTLGPVHKSYCFSAPSKAESVQRLYGFGSSSSNRELR